MGFIEQLGPHDTITRERLEKRLAQISAQLAPTPTLGIVPVSVEHSTASNLFHAVLDIALTVTGGSSPIRFTNATLAVTPDEVFVLNEPLIGGKTWNVVSRHHRSALRELTEVGGRSFFQLGKFRFSIQRPEIAQEYRSLRL